MKKKLSDLLREEVAKENPTTEGETPTAKTSRRRNTTPEPESVTPPHTTEIEESPDIKLELEKQQNLVKTLQEQVKEKQALETEIKEINQQLEQQLQEKQTLSNQLSEAQTQIEDQKKLIEKLYAQLMEKQEEQSLKFEPEPEPEPEPPKAAIVQNFRRSSNYVERLIAPNGSSRTLSDEVIGWFD
ncbi:hypothetical protein C7H19_18825 [Aphanothece hegewaldii CCALA 016]|uniref:Uncharacterized protein n=1 Tax=Aphanothece hegewaldii CCALA 016 TaxID=2107694 RepID=A0A2T1LTV3_9CHRO|nr:hypothetical protein [Aphanothece hegewaldii]PSF34484.1 hypothetical protein C7H19_18825 [Aphanothece hegewaldii CCALA 016]